jgi:hypothetical protein
MPPPLPHTYEIWLVFSRKFEEKLEEKFNEQTAKLLFKLGPRQLRYISLHLHHSCHPFIRRYILCVIVKGTTNK